ncbi:MAG: hypothetical protein JW937_03430, partial [Candidatus Omnitrophica bacterium]|nr:hypothetical protein [Candidatus Omnitrophota bacterium]
HSRNQNGIGDLLMHLLEVLEDRPGSAFQNSSALDGIRAVLQELSTRSQRVRDADPAQEMAQKQQITREALAFLEHVVAALESQVTYGTSTGVAVGATPVEEMLQELTSVSEMELAL